MTNHKTTNGVRFRWHCECGSEGQQTQARKLDAQALGRKHAQRCSLDAPEISVVAVTVAPSKPAAWRRPEPKQGGAS